MSEENIEKTESTTESSAKAAEARPARSQRRGASGRGGKFQRRRKFCKFCADKTLVIDHKDPALLSQFVSERYKIIPSRVTSTCAKHQRQLTTAIKRARVLALLAFTPLHHK